MRKFAALIAGLLALVFSAPASAQQNSQYPTIPYSSIQPTDFILLEGSRFTIPVYTTLPILAQYMKSALSTPDVIAITSAPFNAKCDGATDDTAAIQAAITAATPTGKAVQLCAGVTVVGGAGLSITNTAAGNSGGSNPVAYRTVLQGYGPTTSIIKWAGSSAANPITTYSGAGPTEFRGFSLVNASASKVGIGFSLNQSFDVSFDEIGVQGFQYGINAIDNFSVRVERSYIKNNQYGIYAAFSAYTRPNNWVIAKNTISNNTHRGVWLVAPSAAVINGNAIENNGSGSAYDSGVYIDGGPVDGVMGATISGNYLQGTWGDADIYVTQGNNYSGTYLIEGNDLSRISATSYSTNNILFNRGAGTLTASVIGNSFGAFNGYVASAARRTVDVAGGGPSDSSYNLVSLGNYFYSATDAPIAGTFKATYASDGTITTTSGLTDTGGGVYSSFNSQSVPTLTSGLAITYNFTAGAGETDFWNLYTGASGSSFQWRQKTGVGTSTRLMNLDQNGVLTLLAAPVIVPLTGYLKGNGASALTASATVPLADLATGALPSGVTVNNANWSGTGLALSNLAAQASYTFVANNTAGSASPTAVTGSAALFTAMGVAPNASGGVSLVNGAITAGNCLKWSSSGIQDAGAACGSGGSGITALTGDVTASGTGSVAATLATVNGNVGSFGGASSVPSFTVNAKGLITAASATAVIAPAGTLTGTALPVGITTASGLTTVAGGTFASGAFAVAYALPTATSSVLGGVKPDGTTISNTAGAISLNLGNANSWTAAQTFTAAAPQIVLGANGGNVGELKLNGNTSGALLIVPQAAAGTPTWTAGTSSGTPVVTASAPLTITAATGNIGITGAAGQVPNGATGAFTATPTLGASGTVGTLAFGNATSGTVTLGTVAGALGSVTASLPANTGTIAETNINNNWSVSQTISIAGGSPLFTASNPTGSHSLVMGLADSTNGYIQMTGGGSLYFQNGGVTNIAVNASATASTSSTTGTEVITGGLGVSGAVYSGVGFATTGVAIASLPACAAGNLGMLAIVNNGTVYATGTYGSAVSATGIVTRSVLCANTAGATTYAWAYN